MHGYKFPFVELAALIDLGAKFPFLKEDLSEFVRTEACFQPRSRELTSLLDDLAS